MKSIIEKTRTGYSAYIEGLEGVVATGKTVKKVKRNITEAFIMHINGLREDGNLPAFLEHTKNLTLFFNSELKEVRVGWAEAFKKYAEEGADTLLIPDVFADEKPWEFKKK